MISCTEFIPAYSELFKFLESRGGPALPVCPPQPKHSPARGAKCAQGPENPKVSGTEAVEDFWNYLSDTFLGNLKSSVEEHGLRGCWLYWSHTLNEEAADFSMELDEDAGEFRITMHRCPSMARLLETEHIEPYHNYCGHCAVLYSRVLEPLGFEYVKDLSECHEARCSVIVRRESQGLP